MASVDPYETDRIKSARLPLLRPDFDIFLTESDIATGARFPPERFRARDEHLDALDCIYRSDFSPFVADLSDVNIPISPARRLITVQVDLLMMSTPEAAYPLRTVASDAIRDMLTYGGAVIVVDQGGTVDTLEAEIVDQQSMGVTPNIYTANPLTWYPFEDGGCVLVRPYVSTSQQSTRVDMVEITVIGSQDEPIEVRHHEYDGVGLYGTIGAMRMEGMGGRGGVLLAARSPQEDIWGESVLLDLAPPLLELAKRYTQNSKVLDKNADPTVVWNTSTDDAEIMFPLTQDDIDDDITQQQKINRELGKLRAGDDVQLNDRTQKVAYLEWSGQLEASFQQMQSVREMIAQLSGLPAILDSMIAQAPSGVSLKLQYLPFFAATSALQKDLAEVLSNALMLAGMDGTVEWPHIFEVLDGERNAAMSARRMEFGMMPDLGGGMPADDDEDEEEEE